MDKKNDPTPTAWVDVMERHLREMKYREDAFRRQSADALLKAEEVSNERNKLEHALYTAGLRK